MYVVGVCLSMFLVCFSVFLVCFSVCVFGVCFSVCFNVCFSVCFGKKMFRAQREENFFGVIVCFQCVVGMFLVCF